MRKLIFLCLCLLTACSGRAPLTTTHIEATIEEDRYIPTQWRIPGGQEITLDLTNKTAEEGEWALFIEAPSEPYSADDEPNLILKFDVLPTKAGRLHSPPPLHRENTASPPRFRANWKPVCSQKSPSSSRDISWFRPNRHRDIISARNLTFLSSA